MNRVLVSLVFLACLCLAVEGKIERRTPSPGCRNATDCNDNDMCTTDSCDLVKGCLHVLISCNDNNACTSDTCSKTTGCAYTPTNCNDGKACTTDSCSVTQGCMNVPIAGCTESACNPSCSLNGKCSNATGACSCNSGYTGDGVTCTDIDECADSTTCGTGTKCTNTAGSYFCSARNYMIKNAQSGLVLTGGSDGADVLMTTNKTSNYTDQLWTYMPTGGTGYVVNVKSGYVLDIKNGNPYAGAPVITWDMKPTGQNSNQLWGYDSNFFSNGGMVIDVQYGSTSPGAPILLWTKKTSGNSNQQFVLVEVA